jgi:pyrimidine-specific ribonucleoside hydrolase
VIDPDETEPTWLRGPTPEDPDDDAFWEAETETDRNPVGVWRGLVAEAERRGDHARAERLRAGGPPPEPGASPMVFAPLIAALEIGHDPGGAVAAALAAIDVELLRLVIVVGGPEAARYTRYLLDLIGRGDVAVVAGGPGVAHADTTIADLIPADVPDQPTEVLAAVRAVTSSTPHLIRWANAGPLTDLAAVIHDNPGLTSRLDCTISAAPLDAVQPHVAADLASATAVLASLRRPDIESHDPRAAVRAPRDPTLITVDGAAQVVAADAALSRHLAASGAPPWSRLLAAHIEQWFARGNGPWSLLPSLTVATANGNVYVQSGKSRIVVTPTGRLVKDHAGHELRTSRGVRDHFFLFDGWLAGTLVAAARATSAEAGPNAPSSDGRASG